MIPRSVDDLKRRNRGLARIAEATVGLMGRTPDYMNVKFASFAAALEGLARRRRTERGRRAQPRRLPEAARPAGHLPHPHDHPPDDRQVDRRPDPRKPGAAAQGRRDPAGIVVRGARILATLAPFADEIAVYPAHPLPAGAEAYALAFSIPVDTPGLLFMCRDSAATPGRRCSIGPCRPASTSRTPSSSSTTWRSRARDCSSTARRPLQPVAQTGLRDNMTNQTTIRALTKLEFAYGLATRMAEAIGDASPATHGDAGRAARLRRGQPERRPALRRARPGRG